MLGAAGVYVALPEPLSIGPSWGLLAIMLVLLTGMTVAYRRGRYDISRILTFVASGLITLALIIALIFLIQGIPQHREAPRILLVPPARCGSRTFWSSHSGIGNLTPAVL